MALCTKQGEWQCVTQKVVCKHKLETRVSHEETRKSTIQGASRWEAGGCQAWSVCRAAKVWDRQYRMRRRVTGSEGRKVKGKSPEGH